MLPGDCYAHNDTVCHKLESLFPTNVPDINGNSLFLSQNYPNPADQNTQIKYSVPVPGLVSFTLSDYLGKKLMTFSEQVSAGEHPIYIKTANYPDGMYYYSLTFEGKNLSRKMMLSHAR